MSAGLSRVALLCFLLLAVLGCRCSQALLMASCKNFMITGQPGSGKTTLISKLVQRLGQERGVEVRGFYTEEVRGKGGQRCGFDVVRVPGGQRAVLSRVSGSFPAGKQPASTPAPPTVGSYIVDVPSFESAALPTLALPSAASGRPRGKKQQTTTTAGGGGGPSPAVPVTTTVVVIDEVGKMELFSSAFQRQVAACLDSTDLLVLGSVPCPKYGREIPFVADIKARADTQVWTVRKAERDEAYHSVEQALLAALAQQKKEKGGHDEAAAAAGGGEAVAEQGEDAQSSQAQQQQHPQPKRRRSQPTSSGR